MPNVHPAFSSDKSYTGDFYVRIMFVDLQSCSQLHIAQLYDIFNSLHTHFRKFICTFSMRLLCPIIRYGSTHIIYCHYISANLSGLNLPLLICFVYYSSRNEISSCLHKFFYIFCCIIKETWYNIKYNVTFLFFRIVFQSTFVNCILLYYIILYKTRKKQWQIHWKWTEILMLGSCE